MALAAIIASGHLNVRSALKGVETNGIYKDPSRRFWAMVARISYHTRSFLGEHEDSSPSALLAAPIVTKEWYVLPELLSTTVYTQRCGKQARRVCSDEARERHVIDLLKDNGYIEAMIEHRDVR